MEAVSGILVVIGQILVFIGLIISGFGVYAVLRLDSFYSRSVVTSKVEAMGFVTITVGAMCIAGFSILTLKLFIILIFELLTVSSGAHAIVRSAWISGYRSRTVTDTPKQQEVQSDG